MERKCTVSCISLLRPPEKELSVTGIRLGVIIFYFCLDDEDDFDPLDDILLSDEDLPEHKISHPPSYQYV